MKTLKLSPNFSFPMKLSRAALLTAVLMVFSCAFSPHVTFAQEMGEETPEDDTPLEAPFTAPSTPAPLPDAPRGVQILEVENDNLESLRGLTEGTRADAVSLSATAAELQADAQSWQALATWVRDGGVVFLHGDAARLFGFRTVPARLATNQAPGQLFGRARAALPFAGHPLLVSGVPSRGGLPPVNITTRLPSLGVQTVFYQLNAGDHLVVEHPAATPLLRVTDLASPNGKPLYASAIASFGNGWAIFVPRLVEQHRADGAMFVQNLLRFAQASSSKVNDLMAPPLGQTAPAPQVDSMVSWPASLIELASQTCLDDGDLGTLAAPWNKATAAPDPALFADPKELFLPAKEVRLVLNRKEAVALSTSLASAIDDPTAKGETLKARFRALAYLLRARLEFQRGDLQSATNWLQAANEISPASAEVLLWRGALAVSQSQDITLASPLRAQLLGDAVRTWSSAVTAKSLLQTPAEAKAKTEPPMISSVPREAVQSWIAAAARASELAAAEPPLVSVFGKPGRLMILRYFPNDPTLRLAAPAGDLLARASNFMGWDVEDEEILIFPDERYYTAYSSAARVGTREMAFNPLARRGNVVNNRILMVSQNTTTVLVPGSPPRFVSLGSAVPSTLGRLHAQVLVNALAEGGEPAPSWMQLGLMSLSNTVVDEGLSGNSPLPNVLRQAAANGNLLSPEQFRGVNLGEDRTGAAEAQARRLALYFYERFGAGAVAETLQRLGAGQTSEDALVATTGQTEMQFFLAWRKAELGT